MKISTEYILALAQHRNEINRVPLRDIDFEEAGEVLDIPEKVFAEFELTGMNNMDFITSGFYKGKE